jgi:hypothetical protein
VIYIVINYDEHSDTDDDKDWSVLHLQVLQPQTCIFVPVPCNETDDSSVPLDSDNGMVHLETFIL